MIFSPHFHFKAFPEKERERERERARTRERGEETEQSVRRSPADSELPAAPISSPTIAAKIAIDSAISRRSRSRDRRRYLTPLRSRSRDRRRYLTPSRDRAFNRDLAFDRDRNRRHDLAKRRSRSCRREIAQLIAISPSKIGRAHV